MSNQTEPHTEIELRDGTKEPKSLVGMTLIVLQSMLDEAPLALWDLRTMCDDPNYKPFEIWMQELKERHLVEPDGRIHGSTKNIVRNAVELTTEHIRVRDPVKRTEPTKKICDWQHLAGSFEFTCCGCQRRTTEGYADLNGPAYKAYYCNDCYDKRSKP